MEYEDIQEKLSVLRTVAMAPERVHDIELSLQNEIQKYKRRDRQHKARRGTVGWLASASVAAIACVIGIAAVTHRPNKTTTAASHGPSSVVPIQYSETSLAQIKQTAHGVGVQAYIPYKGLSGDTLTIIKNGGKGNLILDYKNFWVIESNVPIGQPSGVTTQQTISVGHTIGEYQASANNSYLSFDEGNTYIMVQNLKPGSPIPQSALQNIGDSFQPMR